MEPTAVQTFCKLVHQSGPCVCVIVCIYYVQLFTLGLRADNYHKPSHETFPPYSLSVRDCRKHLYITSCPAVTEPSADGQSDYTIVLFC